METDRDGTMRGDYDDALSRTVREALLWVTELRPLYALDLIPEPPDGELESVMAGKSAASTDVGYAVGNALGCLAMDIQACEMEIYEALADPGVAVELEKEATADLVAERRPEVVIMATFGVFAGGHDLGASQLQRAESRMS